MLLKLIKGKSEIFNQLKTYAVSETLAKGLNWVLLLALPKLISIENFGIISLIIAFENLILPISLNGQNVTILRFFDRFKNHKNSFFKSIFKIFLKWNLIIIPIILVISLILYKSGTFIIIIFSVPLLAYREIILNYLRVISDTKRYFKIRVSFQVLKFIFIVSLAFIYPESHYIYPIGLLFAVIISVIQIFVFLKTEINFKLIKNSKDNLSKVFFLFGFPIIFHSLSNAVSMYINRYMIQYFMDEHSVGVFSFAYSLSFSLFFILYIGSLIFQPLLYKSKKADAKSEKNLTIYTNGVFIIISVASIVLWFLFPYILQYYKSDYLKSESVFKTLILATLFIPFYHQGNYRLTLKNKTHLLPIASGIAAFFNIILNIILIPKIGIVGAAYSTLISNIVIMLITNIYSYNLFKLKNLVTIILLISTSIIIILNHNYINYLMYFISFIVFVSIIEIFKNLRIKFK
ncbi:MAG: oligosaccharide flippase family protein [Bacteroidales bacterium]|nr:oligosaccharide flippase family protein [Bacteroidales bacterium]MBN2757432.1 oligosaccharide flippase family protein [Bacteroidales bacterium]